MKFIKKYWFIISLIIISVIRFLISYNLTNYYFNNLIYDDRLVVSEAISIVNNNYLGSYSDTTLIKGIIYPLTLSLSMMMHFKIGTFFTILYILSSLYFIHSFKKITDNKILLLFTYILILFNPLSYSSELFQRIYITSISLVELLLFLGTIINIIYSKNNSIINYIILGIVVTIMYLTRDDAIWTFIVLIALFIYKLKGKINIRNIVKCSATILIIILGLNLVSYINYRHYDIYTYSEVKDTYFKKAYFLLLKIKDDDKIEQVSIPKSTLYKVADNTDIFLTREEIDSYYSKASNKNSEIDNGNIMWSIRRWIYNKYNFKNGKEANEYYKKLYYELKELFKQKKLESEMFIPVVNINMISYDEIKKFPIEVLKTIWYSSSYKNVRTFSEISIGRVKDKNYDNYIESYLFSYDDYRHSENIIKDNIAWFEIIRILYKYFTIIFSVVAFFVFICNFRKKDDLNILNYLIMISYIIILFGVVHTHITAFFAIRYRYLCNIYLLQSIFIILNIERFLQIKRKN